MKFAILGPVTAGAGMTPTATRDRIVLATLLLRPDRIVGVDELVDALWAENPPATARAQVQTCVSRLRRLLPPGTIKTNPAGYGVNLGPDDLDAVVFARLVAEARAASDDTARKLLREALDLWRGPALDGLQSAVVRQAAVVLDEQHAAAVEEWVDLELNGGRADDLVAELGALVDQFPLRERMRGQLMRALALAGRTSDALAEYDRIAAALREQAGIEPGTPLRELRDRLAAAPSAGTAVRCLPRPVSDFTGRDREVAGLVATVESAAGPAVVVIDGMAGVGKSALAGRLAALVGHRYPDAHLFVDLRGHSDGSPLDPGVALTSLLRQWGVEPDRIPTDLDEQLTLWRSRLAGRRVLVVFDNAATSAQVDRMLPTESGHLAIVTSRRRLTGLDGVRVESLGVLDERAGVALLARIVGARVDEDPAAAATLVRRCGGLPLAIRLAAARLVHRPRWRVADLVRRLDTAGLPALAAEDRSVAGVFALSYGQLPAVQQRAFALLGVHPDLWFDGPAVAALAGLPLAEAERLIEAFVAVHLIEEPAAGSYRLHDLMREYAAILAGQDAAGVDAAIRRVATHYREVVEEFGRGTQMRTTGGRRNEPLSRPELVAAIGDVPAWLETHRTGLSAVVEAVWSTGDAALAWRLAQASFRFCLTRGYIGDVLEIQTLGLAAARMDGDSFAIAESLYFLSAAATLTGRLREAIDLQTEAVGIHLAADRPSAVAKVRKNLAGSMIMIGRLDEAWETAVSAVDAWWRAGVGFGWQGLITGGEAAMYQGRYDVALRCQRLMWSVGRMVGDPVAPASAVAELGEIRLRMGQPKLAAVLLRGGLRRKAELNYRIGTVGDLTRLAVALRELGELPAAIEHHERALSDMIELNELRWESVVCNDYAGTLLAAGDGERALELYRRAYKRAEQSEINYELARALTGIARCLADADPAQSRADGRRAHGILAAMGAADRFELERWLGESGMDQLRESGGGSTIEG